MCSSIKGRRRNTGDINRTGWALYFEVMIYRKKNKDRLPENKIIRMHRSPLCGVGFVPSIKENCWCRWLHHTRTGARFMQSCAARQLTHNTSTLTSKAWTALVPFSFFKGQPSEINFGPCSCCFIVCVVGNQGNTGHAAWPELNEVVHILIFYGST